MTPMEGGITVVGCGGLGSQVALTLMRQGERLTLYDDDRVEEKNLTNQAYLRQHVGMKKVDALWKFATVMSRWHPFAEPERVTAHTHLATPVVIACVDSLEARRDILDATIASQTPTPFIDGRLGGGGGRVFAFNPHREEDVAFYRQTLQGEAVLQCVVEFNMHYALMGAGLVVRALRMATSAEYHSVERMLILEGVPMRVIKDGPHPWNP